MQFETINIYNYCQLSFLKKFNPCCPGMQELPQALRGGGRFAPPPHYKIFEWSGKVIFSKFAIAFIKYTKIIIVQVGFVKEKSPKKVRAEKP